jgi:hypothetical protein
MRRQLNFATVCSVAALVISMGGVGYAATKLPNNSVGNKQLKANAVTTSKVKNGSLTGKDIKASTLGTVPKATHAGTATTAGTATNALALGGTAASGFQKPGSAVSGDLSGTASAPTIGSLPYGSVNTEEGECGTTNSNVLEFSTASVHKQAGVSANQDTGCTGGDTTLAVTRAGIYDLTAGVGWTHDTTGDRKVQILVVNFGESCDTAESNGQLLASAEVPPTAGTNTVTVVPVSIVAPLNEGQGVCVTADALGASTATLIASSKATFLSLAYLSANSS